MNLNDLEFRGMDKFYKYRYLNEFHGNYGTIEETWEMGNQVLKYQFTAEFLKRAYNIRANLLDNKIGYFEIKRIYEEPELFKDIHSIMFPVQSSFFEKRFDYFVPTSVFDTSATFVVSAAPKKVVSTAMSFLAMDAQVMISTGMLLIIISCVLTIHSIILTRKYQQRMNITNLIRSILDYIWNYTALFFKEPLIKTPKNITPRLIASSWLLGVTLILFFLGCYLNTEFSIVTFNYIDTLSDLIKSGVPPLIIEGDASDEFVKKLASDENDEIRNWIEGLNEEDNSCSLMDLLDISGYSDILSGKKALIISKLSFVWLLGEVLNGDPEAKDLIARNGGLYISSYELHMDYLHIIMNQTWISNMSPLLQNIVYLTVTPIFECQPYAYLDFPLQYPIDYVSWKKPQEAMVDLSLFNMASPLLLLIILESFSFIMLFLEILFDFKLYKM